jgi:hypothetical protein
MILYSRSLLPRVPLHCTRATHLQFDGVRYLLGPLVSLFEKIELDTGMRRYDGVVGLAVGAVVCWYS